jgi:hypothetical protein
MARGALKERTTGRKRAGRTNGATLAGTGHATRAPTASKNEGAVTFSRGTQQYNAAMGLYGDIRKIVEFRDLPSWTKLAPASRQAFINAHVGSMAGIV